MPQTDATTTTATMCAKTLNQMRAAHGESGKKQFTREILCVDFVGIFFWLLSLFQGTSEFCAFVESKAETYFLHSNEVLHKQIVFTR